MKTTLLRMIAAALTGLFLVGAYAGEGTMTQADCEAAGGTWDEASQSCTMPE